MGYNYKWEPHRQTCYRLYVEQNLSLDDTIEYMREHHDFTPRYVPQPLVFLAVRVLGRGYNHHSVVVTHSLTTLDVNTMAGYPVIPVSQLIMTASIQPARFPGRLLPLGLSQQDKPSLQNP